MSQLNSPNDEQSTRITAGQWFILALLVLLNATVVVLLILALTGQLTL